MAGWVAPLLLCLLRFGQGFGLGGEWGGAALLAVENAPNRQGLVRHVPSARRAGRLRPGQRPVPVAEPALTPDEFRAWGWRLPFLAASLLVGVGLWVRLKLTETPAFAQAMAEAPPSHVPLAEVFKRYPRRCSAGRSPR